MVPIFGQGFGSIDWLSFTNENLHNVTIVLILIGKVYAFVWDVTVICLKIMLCCYFIVFHKGTDDVC